MGGGGRAGKASKKQWCRLPWGAGRGGGQGQACACARVQVLGDRRAG